MDEASKLPIPVAVRIKYISWDVWVFFVLFIWIGVFHILFSPMAVKKQLLLDWLPEMVKHSSQTIAIGKDMESAINMASTLTFTLLDISLRSMAWWVSTYAVLRYAVSGKGVKAFLVPIGKKYMLVADKLKTYRTMILIATMLAAGLYAVKDYVLYVLLISKGIDPVSAGWLFIVNLGGIISMIVVTIIWVLLPDKWLAKMWLVRAALNEEKDTILSIDIAPRNFIGYFVAFSMVSAVVVLITYPSVAYLLPLVFVPLLIEWWMGGVVVSLFTKMLTGMVKPAVHIESEGVWV
ncbi:MAG: hypothetical protein GXO59_02475 [Dictyoglomi bacterium]|nr:hypothetical protein [Dictyoglomota bacterium]